MVNFIKCFAKIQKNGISLFLSFTEVEKRVERGSGARRQFSTPAENFWGVFSFCKKILQDLKIFCK